jgi:peptidyl-prolyl cis-trans isomerase SurA
VSGVFDASGLIRCAALVSALVAVAGVSVAQTVPDDGPVANTPLKLPSDAQVFGKRDPSVRKATAIVNGDIITETDVDQRLALVIASNGGEIPAEEREQVRQQIVRNLIDETLQIQEASANEIKITPQEVDQTFSRVSANFKKTPATFGPFLTSIGSSPQSMRRQIEGELAWSRLLRRNVESTTAVSDAEVKAVIDRLEASKGKTEFHVFEIFLPATPDTQAGVLENANRIIQQLRSGASFQAYATQYSQASTAAVGGDLGWVRPELLPEELATVVQQMPEQSISQPIALAGGYSILALAEKRQVLGSDPSQAVLSLKQVTIKFPAGTTQTQATPAVEKFAAAMRSVAGCGTVEKVAAGVGAEVGQNDAVRFGNLPPIVQQLVGNLQIGQASQPFGSVDRGISALVLCGRDDPGGEEKPSFDQVYSQIERERVAMRARRYLRDLRRDAVVDYR